MYFLRFVVFPGPSHPERERMGESLALCWIDRPAEAEADAVARTEIGRDGWEIVEREEASEVTADDYEEDDEFREYFEQATTDGEVLLFVTSPRFPVYWVSATVEKDGEAAELHYFVCGDSVRGEDEDVYDPDFWAGDRAQAALDETTEEAAAVGWAVAAITDQRPCGRGDVPAELQRYFDEAEADGSCLVFVHEGRGESPA